jgi:ABC-2 type transport system permease protein
MRLGGVMLAFWLIGLLNVFYWGGFVFWLQDYPRGGNLAGLAIAGALYIAAIVTLAFAIKDIFRTRERAFQFIVLLSLPLFFLANLTWPKTSSPLLLTWIAKMLPSTAGINAMIKFNQMGATLKEGAPELVNLVILVALYGGITIWRQFPRVAPAGQRRMPVFRHPEL